MLALIVALWALGVVVATVLVGLAYELGGRRTAARAALLVPIWPAWIVIGAVKLWRLAELWPHKSHS